MIRSDRHIYHQAPRAIGVWKKSARQNISSSKSITDVYLVFAQMTLMTVTNRKAGQNFKMKDSI